LGLFCPYGRINYVYETRPQVASPVVALRQHQSVRPMPDERSGLGRLANIYLTYIRVHCPTGYMIRTTSSRMYGRSLCNVL
jgi:hypothetical protein